MCWSLFLIKLQAFRAATLLKKKTPTHVFSCKYCENFKNAYLEGRTSANCYFCLLLKVDYFAIYCTYSALTHFTIHVHYTDDEQLSVYFY